MLRWIVISSAISRARHAPRMSVEPDARLAAVRRDLTRGATHSAEPVLVDEQLLSLSSAVSELSALLADEFGDSLPPMTPGPLEALPRERLDSLLAPRLPLLMLRNYPELVREALTSVRTQAEQRALFELNKYVLGAYEEMADEVVDLKWQQLNKLRELCDAAVDGGPEELAANAEAMRAELDEAFCNFLNEAIEQEEERLRGEGIEPLPQAEKWLPRSVALPAAAAAANVGEPAADSLASEEEDIFSSTTRATLEPKGTTTNNAEARISPAEAARLAQQQWLLVLRVVKQGVYSLLARDRVDDVQQLRYITNIASVDGRRELTAAITAKMLVEEQQSFVQTVRRVQGSLSVPRDAREAELHERTSEVFMHLRDLGLVVDDREQPCIVPGGD